MNGKFFRFFKEYDSLFSIGEKLYITLNTILILFGASGVSAIIAIIDPKKNLTLTSISLIFIITISCVFIIIAMYRWSQLNSSKKTYYDYMGSSRSTINPLSENFADEIINMEQLRLPALQHQENKTFRRCILIGPSAAAIFDGEIRDSVFFDCGDVFSMSPTIGMAYLNGTVVFKNCRFIDCKFINTTLILPEVAANLLKQNMPETKILKVTR